MYTYFSYPFFLIIGRLGTERTNRKVKIPIVVFVIVINRGLLDNKRIRKRARKKTVTRATMAERHGVDLRGSPIVATRGGAKKKAFVRMSRRRVKKERQRDR